MTVANRKTSSGAAASQSGTATSANPNGHIAVVFTYGGKALTYQEFLSTFYVTLPGGPGVQLGQNQFYGYQGASGTQLTLGASVALTGAASPIDALLPTNAPSGAKLNQAFTQWAADQAASPGQTSYANLYLSHYTGGRVYLSNGDLDLGSSGEPSPNSTTDHAYDMLYDIFEPYIGAQIDSTTIPGNLADITDIDWFSFPITLKVWNYDFANDPGVLVCQGSARGGDGSSIWKSLLIPEGGSTPTNQYPSTALPAPNGDTAPRRLVAPTMAATAGYYSDPAKDPFPYSYFDAYLLDLQSTQGKKSGLFTFNGTFGGVGNSPYPVNLEPQNFSFTVDFSGIESAPYLYPSGSATKITPSSQVVLSGYTHDSGNPILGSASAPFTISLPWAKGSTQYALPVSAENDALLQGWLSVPATAPTANSGTYSPLAVTAQDSDGNTLTPVFGLAQLQLIYSVNKNPQGGVTDNLYGSDWLTLSGASGLTCTPMAVYTQADAEGCVLTVGTDANGALNSLEITDFGTGPTIAEGAQWVVAAAAAGLGNNQSFTVALAKMPQLRNAFILSSATYAALPASISVTPVAGSVCTLDVNSKDLLPSFQPSADWITLSQPGGIYGANAGYTIAGLTGDDAQWNGNVKSLQNDVFGWVVADLLAALNTGLVAAPVTYPPTQESVGDSSQDWFYSADNPTTPYSLGLWGAGAWTGAEPASDFWDSWGWELFNVEGGTDAYNFAFTDRFVNGILVAFDPPPAQPAASYPVLLEVVVGDSPLLGVATLQANQAWFDTGIDVAATAKSITYLSGLWTADPHTNGGNPYDANGCPGLIVTQPGYPLVDKQMGALVGRIGSAPVFLVGDGATTPSGQSGRLYLCINDDLNHLYGAGLADNSGSITVKIG